MVEKTKNSLSEIISKFNNPNLWILIFLVLYLLVMPFLILFFQNTSNNIDVAVTLTDFLILCVILVSFAMMVGRRTFKLGMWIFIIVSVFLAIFISLSGNFDINEQIWLTVYPLIAMAVLGVHKARKRIIFQNQLYSELFENVPIGIYQMSMVGEVIKINQKMVSIFEYETTDSFLKACSRSEIFKPAVLLDQVAEIIREKGFINGFERKVITKNGREITLRENIRRINSFALPTGKIVFFEGMVEDISDFKETEEQQSIIRNELAVLSASTIKFAVSKDNDEILRIMLEQLSVLLSDAMIFISDIEIDSMTCAVRYFYMRADLTAGGTSGGNDSFLNKNYNMSKKLTQNILTGEIITLDEEQSSIINEKIFENKRYILDRISPVKNYLMSITWNKKVFATICIIMTNDNKLTARNMDVIETLCRQVAVTMDRNTYLKGVKRQAEFIELLNDTIPVPVFYKDRDGKFIGCNRYFEEFTGCNREELYGEYDTDVLFTENATQNVTPIKELFQKGKNRIYDSKIRRADGMIRTATFFESVYFDANSTTYGTISAFVDKTEERELFEKLSKARADAEAVARLKSEFLTTVSHEMRTPLTTILVISEMLQKNSFNNINEFKEILAEAAERLFELIDNIIDASLMQDGRFFIEEQQFCPKDVYNDLFNIFKNVATNKNLQFTMDVNKNLPQVILGDRYRFFQVLKQIISNAIKFTSKGEVIVKADMDRGEKEESRIYLVTTITDTGIGIPVEMQSSLFEFFNQADGSLTRGFNGSGIGLALAKRITELMEGWFKLYSKPDCGSNVTISIPFRLPLTNVNKSHEWIEE